MNAQDVILGARVAHVRELKAEVERLRSENDALRAENGELRSHFDLALVAAEDLSRMDPGGRLVVMDGWNLILGAKKEAGCPDELVAQAKAHLEANPLDCVWIVFDGPRFDVRTEGRLRISWTGGRARRGRTASSATSCAWRGSADGPLGSTFGPMTSSSGAPSPAFARAHRRSHAGPAGCLCFLCAQ